MCLWKERRYSVLKTLLQTIHGPLFSQRRLHSLQPRLCLCLLAYKWLNLFPTAFFPPSSLLLLRGCGGFFLHCFELTVKRRPGSYEQLKYSAHPGFHIWQCGFYITNEASAQEMFPWKSLHSWSVGSCQHLYWFMPWKWLFLRARMKFVISIEYAWAERAEIQAVWVRKQLSQKEKMLIFSLFRLRQENDLVSFGEEV